MLVKNSISTLSVLFLFTFSLLAQAAPEKERMSKGPIDFSSQMELSEEQEVKMKQILDANRTAIKEIFRNSDLDKEQKKSAKTSQEQKMKSQLAEFLNEDQLSKFEEMQSQRKERRLMKRLEFRERTKEKYKERESLRKERKELMAKKKKAIKEYREKNVDPTLLEQRKKLEAKLSEEDKQKIDEIRVKKQKAVAKRKLKQEERKKEFKALKEERKEKMKTEFKARKEERKEKMKAFKEEHREDRETIEYLLNKYDSEIEELMKEIENERIQWKNDISGIFKEGRKHKSGIHKGKDGHGSNDHRRSTQDDSNINGSLARFLLLDPKGVSKEVVEKSSMENSIGEFTVFPNPAKHFNTLKYSIKESGNVQIGLYEEGGRLVKSILNEYVEAGDYEFNINVQDLRPAYYIYTIKTEKGVISRRILISE